MPLHIPVGFGQAHIVFRLTGDPEEMITSTGFSSHIGTTAADLLNSQSAVLDDFEATVLDGSDAATIQDLWTFVGMRFEWVSSDEGPGGFDGTVNLVGTSDDGTIPNNGALLVQKHTGLTGRKHRGRFYFPPFNLAEGEVNNNGIIDSTLLGVLNDRFQAWVDLLDTHDTNLELLHTDPADAPNRIAQLVVEAQIGSQRRRLRH